MFGLARDHYRKVLDEIRDSGLWKDERIIASPAGGAVLYRQRVGKGQVIYVGWEIAASLPATRDKDPTLEGERSFDEQMRIILAIAADATSLLSARK